MKRRTLQIFALLIFCVQLKALSQIVLTNATNGYLPGYKVWLYYNWSVNTGYYPVSPGYTSSLTHTWDLHDMTTLLGQRLDYNHCPVNASQIITPNGDCVLNTDDYIVRTMHYPFMYNVPDTLMKFPMAQGDHFNTTYYTTNPISTSAKFRTVYGTDSVAADLAGKLILPHATFDEVLRIRTVSNFTDSSHSTADTVFRTRTIKYAWYSPMHRQYLLVLDTSYLYRKWGFDITNQVSVYSGYTLPFPMAVADPAKPHNLLVSPNPAGDVLTVSCAEGLNSVIICNLTGHNLLSQSFTSRQADLDIAHLPAGVYFIKVNGSEVRRFVKQ
ncbi:MAG: hypothetical protein K0Q79_820 [Flavipsychrobacter sp.]|jgi:hypothetical protein|nr:hypothetical protein [Flavipsychrobacter sp.]